MAPSCWTAPCRCCGVLCNSCRKDGTTPFERIFMSQEAGPKDSIEVILELLPGEPDFALTDVEPNVMACVREYERLRQVLTPWGRWVEVDVDVRNHIRFISESAPPSSSRVSSALTAPLVPGGAIDSGGAIEEMSVELHQALANNPAFLDTDGGTPFWQVVVSRRRIVFQIHHMAVDGVGLAMIASTLINGSTLEQTVSRMSKVAAPPSQQRMGGGGGCCSCPKACCTGCCSLIKHSSTPFVSCCCGHRASPIARPDSFAELEDIHHLHLGPYSLPTLLAASRRRGVTLNSTLLAVIAAAFRQYSASQGGDAKLPLSCAIPINFKRPDCMRVDNDFSTLFYDIPAPDADGDLLVDPAGWSMPVAKGASVAQGVLSSLPMCAVSWMLDSATRMTNFIFSNVNGAYFGDEFVSTGTGVRRKVRGFAFGALNGVTRVFVLVNSHGNDLHIGLTVDEAVVADRRGLSELLHKEIMQACQ